MKDTIKVGLILDRQLVPLWVYRVIDKLIYSKYAEIKLVVYNKIEGAKRGKTKNSFIYQFHEKLDQHIFRNRVDYNKTVGSSELLNGVPEISLNSESQINYDEITEYNLDLILNFSFFVFNNPKIELAKYGVWNYHIDNQNIDGNNSDGYWEMVNKRPVIAVSLRCSNGLSENGTIHRSWVSVNYNSIHINRDHVFGLCSFIFPRLIAGIYQFGPDFIKMQSSKHKDEKTVMATNSKIFFPPSDYQALINMAVILFRYLYRNLVYLNKLKWFLMYKINPNQIPVRSNDFKPLVPPEDRFWADPFVLSVKDKFYVFVEEFLYRKNKGHITLLELNNKGQLIHAKRILERPYHMSYPFVFVHENRHYMIPETSGNKTIELFRCEEFPEKWHFNMNLMENINAVDTTIFYYLNKWWLFTSINESPGFPDHRELFLYYSNELLTTNWTPHPSNPIITDVRTARPAGRIFIHDQKIYRPSQDCSGSYGKAFNLNEITILNEREYSEKMISKIGAKSESDQAGTHTFNFDENITLIDVYTFCKRFSLYKS